MGNKLVLSGISNKFNKPLYFIVTIFKKMGATPNHLTLIGLFFSILAGYTYYTFSTRTRLWPFFLLLLSGLFDALDGAMARKYSLETKLGGIIDSIIDRISEAIIFFCLILSGNVDIFWGLLALISSLMVSYIRARAERENYSLKGRGIAERPERLIILLIATLINQLNTGVIIIAVLSLVTIIQRIYHLVTDQRTHD